MTDIKARPISDCVPLDGNDFLRLLTVETRAPQMVHQEVLRHRRIITEEGLTVTGLGWDPDFSYSVSSTRAVPFAKLVQEVRDPSLRAAPIHWGTNRPGMVPGEEMDDEEKNVDWYQVLSSIIGPNAQPAQWITQRECAKRLWDLGAQMSGRIAETMVHFCDPHKSIPNRMIAPYTHYNVLMTGTAPGWLNFMGLRLDGAADPIVRALADKIWIVWNESTPRVLESPEWAIPYADDDQTCEELLEYLYKLKQLGDLEQNNNKILQKMSVARCAHLSYTSFETGDRMTVEQCLKLYDRLVGSVPIHASPAEHQATPDRMLAGRIMPRIEANWEHPELAGNLGPGWIQLRKLLPNEAVAPLPEKYR